MSFELININGIAMVSSNDLVLTDITSALDLIATANYQAKSCKIIILKENIAEEFFKLSSGLLGEVLQKFVNYGVYLSIVGDFSAYTSVPLKDFIYESNNNRHIFFTDDVQKAVEKLSKEY